MNNLKSKLTQNLLEKEYKLCKSMNKMAEKLGVSIDSISKYMKLYNISYYNTPPTYSVNENIFKEETEQSFYLAGFIAADGCVMKRKDYPATKVLKIGLATKDQKHLEKIKQLLNSTHPIHNEKTHYPSVSLSIVSKTIFKDLAKFNIVPRKTLIYQFPEWLIDHSLVHHFMRGYIDGDGCFRVIKPKTKNRTVSQVGFTLRGTVSFLTTFVNIIEKHCGLTSINRVKKYDYCSVASIAYSGNISCDKLYNFLYKDATIYLERKYLNAKMASILKRS